MRASRPGKIPTTSAAADLAVEPLLRAVAPDLPPDRLREGGEGEDVGAGRGQVGSHLRELVRQRVQDPAELGMHGRRVGLVMDPSASAPGPIPRYLRGISQVDRGHELG
jgi:hypothetical protein